MNKESYSLNEIETKYSIPKEDIFWMAEKGKIRLFLFCKPEKVIVGYHDKQGFHAVGYATYRGIFLAPRYLEQKLADEGKVEVSGGRAAKSLSSLSLNDTYPFNTELPNKLIASWGAKNQDKANSKYPEFIFFPREADSWAGLASTIFGPYKNFDPKSPMHELMRDLEDKPKNNLVQSSREFSFEDIRISHNALQLIKEQISADSAIQNSEPLHKQLIRRVINKYPSYSSGKILEAIKQDMDKDSPEFDTDCILIEVSKSEIVWQGKDHDQHTLIYASFKNLVSRIKKEK